MLWALGRSGDIIKLGTMLTKLLCLGVLALGATAQDLPLEVKYNLTGLTYPRVGQLARVQGVVQLQLIPDVAGQEIKVLSGPPMLVSQAKDNLAKWRTNQPITVNYLFRLTDAIVKVRVPKGNAFDRLLLRMFHLATYTEESRCESSNKTSTSGPRVVQQSPLIAGDRNHGFGAVPQYRNLTRRVTLALSTPTPRCTLTCGLEVLMKSTRLSFFFNFTLTLILLVAAAGLMFSQNAGQPQQKGDQPQAKGFGKQKAPERPGSVEKITVHGKSLEGNLEGDSPDRDVFVYLPLSYAKNKNQRYPVVYFLHGYGIGAEAYMNALWASDGADKDVAAGTSKEMIVVFPDSYTIYNGSMYSNSPTTGNWETFITEDLIQLHRQPLPNYCRS